MDIFKTNKCFIADLVFRRQPEKNSQNNFGPRKKMLITFNMIANDSNWHLTLNDR